MSGGSVLLGVKVSPLFRIHTLRGIVRGAMLAGLILAFTTSPRVSLTWVCDERPFLC